MPGIEEAEVGLSTSPISSNAADRDFFYLRKSPTYEINTDPGLLARVRREIDAAAAQQKQQIEFVAGSGFSSARRLAQVRIMEATHIQLPISLAQSVLAEAGGTSLLAELAVLNEQVSAEAGRYEGELADHPHHSLKKDAIGITSDQPDVDDCGDDCDDVEPDDDGADEPKVVAAAGAGRPKVIEMPSSNTIEFKAAAALALLPLAEKQVLASIAAESNKNLKRKLHNDKFRDAMAEIASRLGVEAPTPYKQAKLLKAMAAANFEMLHAGSKVPAFETAASRPPEAPQSKGPSFPELALAAGRAALGNKPPVV